MASSRAKFILPGIVILGLILAYMVQQGGHYPEIVSLEKGKPAPDFVLRDMDGRETRLSDYRGRLVFLNFWATWCPPCRDEMPSMEQLHQLMKGRPFKMLAVSVDTDASTAKKYMDKHGFTFTTLADHQQKVAGLYQTTGIPETFLINAEGILLLKVIGPDNWSSPRSISAIEELLPPPSPQSG